MARKREEIARFTKAGPVELDNPLLNGIWLPYANHFAQHASYGPGATLGDDESAYSRVLRSFATKEYAWAIPSNEAVSTILSYGRHIVEIGSGHGYWASLLAAAGGNVIAVDDSYVFDPRYFPETVHQDGAAYLREHEGAQHATLFVCWGSDMDEALAAFKGNYLAVVGEEPGGCTWWPGKGPEGYDTYGDQAAREKLIAEQTYEQWTRIQTVEIPQWQSRTDCLAIFQRKNTDQKHDGFASSVPEVT